MHFYGLIFLLLVTARGVEAASWLRHAIDATSQGADGVRLADVNRDGLLDITTGWEEGGRVRVYLNPGPKKAKAPWPAVTVGRVSSPEDAVFVDLDHDGVIDVVSSCEGRTRTMFLHWAPGRPSDYLDPSKWTTQAVPATVQREAWMFSMPLSLDPLVMVAGSKGVHASISLLFPRGNPRQPGLWHLKPIYKAGWIMSLRALDMDGDGDLDVLASDRKGPSRGILWLEAPGRGRGLDPGEWKAHRIGARDQEVMFLDVIRDRSSVQIFAAIRPKEIALFRRGKEIGRRWTAEAFSLPDQMGTSKAVRAADIDQDRRLDLVVTCEHAVAGKSGVGWFERRRGARGAHWRWHDISGPAGVKFDRIELIDLDGDGDQDVLTCEERDNLGVIWYENPTVQD